MSGEGNKEVLKELAAIRDQAKSVAAGEVPLPQGAAPLASAAPEGEESPAPEGAEAPEGTTEAPAVQAAPQPQEEEAELIRIGDREFKSQAEALRYAESLAHEKEIAEAYNMGIRETLQATQAPPEAPPEENFEEKFYSNPKLAIEEAARRAEENAIQRIKAETARESQWNRFLAQYPDIDREDAERVLQRPDVLAVVSKIKSEEEAMKVLARHVRSEYQRIAEKFKPRTELPNKQGQVVSTGNSQKVGVTPTQKEAAPLTMAQQMRQLRNRA